ncbi:hypothetical protein [Leuconostoc mesenteroides]|uniref:hypothetical protein n=1 Tax=Leuconostoc mesenteroides TaxID=1245 RepID=UPI002362405E|nr:hypothetical protein [Leuconostoc mesenteroides]
MASVPDALNFYQGDIQEEPVGFKARLFDFSSGEYITKQFRTEGKAYSAIAEQVDRLNEIAIELDEQNFEQVYISRDLKEGRLEQYQINNDDGTDEQIRFLDYGDFMTDKEVMKDAKDYKKTVYRKMAQMIYEAAERGDNVENLVMASREIRNTLERISK